MRLFAAFVIAIIVALLWLNRSNEGFRGRGGGRFYPFGMSKIYRSEVGWPWYSPGFGWPLYKQNCNLTGCPDGSLCVTDPRGSGPRGLNSYCMVI